MENRTNTEWKVIRDEEDQEELVNADWIVMDQFGELVANVHGRTVGDCITNADLIASAPRLQQRNQDMDFAIRRLIKAFTSSPTAGVANEAERKNAIFQQSVDRSEAIKYARSLISWHNAPLKFDHHCQNGQADLCLAARADGVVCPHNSCDIDDGIVSYLPCPRCGHCGFIEDADMNLAGECPECDGKGQKTPEIAGGSWEEQCMAARELTTLFKSEAEVLRKEKFELVQISETINQYASGPMPWGGCKCDHGEDGKTLLRGEKCGRCRALERLNAIKNNMIIP